VSSDSGRLPPVERVLVAEAVVTMMMNTTEAGSKLERIDIRQALTFPFSDQGWAKKIAIGALFALGPIIVVGIFFLVGYLIEITRRVAEGSEEPLPEWRGNFGTYFKQGFPAAWGVLIWLLPVQALWVGAALVLGGQQSIPVQLVFGLTMLVTVNLYAAVVMPSVIGAYAADPHFGSMFRLGEIAGSIRRIGANFVAVWIVHLAVLALTFVTIWMIVMIIFTTAYAAMTFGHVYGQAARIATR
jgi:hypothetical protein